jgi:hypothetical protein
MPAKLHFSFKDVPRAARFGFSAKKIWVQFLGLLIGTIVYDIFAYLGLLLSGMSLTEIWREYHFLPVPIGESLTFLGLVLVLVGALFFGVIIIFSGVAISKITFEQLKGDEFYEVGKALKFSLKEGRAAITSILTLVIVAIFIFVGGIILGLIGKIPWFGELFLLLMSVPAFFACLFLVYLFFSFIFAYFLAASIVATTKADTFDSLFEIFSTLNEQNWRFVTYETLLYATKFVAFSIFAWTVGKALLVAHKVLTLPWLMGTKYAGIEQAALSYLPGGSLQALYAVEPYLRFLGVDVILRGGLSAPSLSVPQSILGFIFGIFLYFIIYLVLSYWGAMHWAGNTLIFVVLAKKKDDIDLLQVKEEEPLEGPEPEREEVEEGGEPKEAVEEEG